MRKQSIKNGLLLLFVLVFQMSFGQISDESFDPTAESARLVTVPNSPEAQAFTKYGNTPVNMYTGTPNIQIPLYTHKGRELDLPISLSYDASGIKVEQLATQVGLGWNLNVGGRISRIVNGLPDDFYNSVHTTQQYYSLWDNATDDTPSVNVNARITEYSNLTNNPSFYWKQDLIAYMYFLKRANDNKYDTQPDYFSFNALGNTDMFTVDVVSKTPKSLDNPRLNVVITKAFGGANTPITKWVVTTDDGTIYTFEEEEVTRDINLNYVGGTSLYGLKKEYNSSWLLTKIVSSHAKDVYEFTYSDLGFWNSNRTASSVAGVTNVIEEEGGAPESVPSPTDNAGFSNTEYTIKQKVLSSITHNGELIVDVDLLTNRWDMDVNSAIDKINVYDEASPSPVLYKSFVFDYDYFRTTTAVAPPYDVNNIPNDLLIRLKLDGITINDRNSNSEKFYAFTYNDPYLMPSTTSKAQDYYGFYNGQTSNTVLYPTYSHQAVPSGDGANRDSNFNFAKRGLLNKITYPTRGHTEFEYEANYSQEPDGSSTVWQTLVSTSLTNPVLPSPIDPNACNGLSPSNELVTPAEDIAVFEVTVDQTDYNLVYDRSSNVPSTVFYNEKKAILIKIPTANDTLTWAEVFDSNCNLISGVDLIWTLFKPQSFPHSETITLDQGHYQLLLTNSSTIITNSFEVQESTVQPNYVYEEKAGVRVKSIKDYTDATTLALHKTYEYPSGTVISNPIYSYTSTQYSLDNWGYPIDATILHRVSYASGLDKPHMGYAKVKETVVDAIGAESNGKTFHKFNTAHYGNYKAGVYSYYINGKKTANQYGVTYQLGKSSGNEIYDDNGLVVSSSSNTYYDKEYYSNSGLYLHMDESKSDLFPIPTASGGKWVISYVSYQKIATNNSQAVGLQIPPECSDSNFLTSTNKDKLCKPDIARLLKQTSKAWGKVGNIINSRSKQYYNASTDIIEQITDYSYYDDGLYGDPQNYLIKNTETKNSKDETIKKEFFYPTTGALVTANIYVPIEIKNYKNNNLISSKKTIYSGILPDTIKTAKGSQALDDRLLFERYVDDNLVQVKQVGGTTTAYIWGYDKRYVVAKIENATYGDIEDLLVNFGTGFTIADGLSVNQENDLRNIALLPNALVTTYTYDPLVGVTSITDANGQTITYHYDAFNRLQFVKDEDGNLLSENKYHYKE